MILNTKPVAAKGWFVLAYLGISSFHRFDGGKGAMLDVPKESLISELLMDSIFNSIQRQKATMTMTFLLLYHYSYDTAVLAPVYNDIIIICAICVLSPFFGGRVG